MEYLFALSVIICLFCHFYGDGLFAELLEREVVESSMTTFRTPGVFHDEVFLTFVVVGNAYDGHGVALALPTDTVVLSDGTFGFGQQGVHGDVIETVMPPVVGQVYIYI